MTFNIAYNFEAHDNFTRVSQKINASVEKVDKKVQKLNERLRNTGKSLAGLGKKMMLRVTVPLMAFGLMAVKSASNIEDMNIAFTGMLHSATKAKAMVKSLIEFTARTPFELPEVQHAAQQLLTFGFTTKQVIPLLTELGNIAAVKKVPLSELASIFGRVHARGKATVRELMPLVRMGTPIIKVLQQMAKEAGHAGVDIFKVAGKGAVTAKVWDAAFLRMTTGGGMFAGAAEKMAHSVSGLFSTLKDNLKLVLVPIGDMIIDSLDLKKNMQSFIDVLGRLRIKIAVFEKAHKQLSKIIVIVGLIAAALAPVLVALGTMVFLTGLAAVGFEAIWAAILSPITLTVIAIAVIVAGFIELYKHVAAFRFVIKVILGIIKIIWIVVKTILVLFFKLFMLVNKGLLSAFKAIAHVVMKLIVHPIMKMIKGIESMFSSKHKGTIEMKKSMMMQQSPFLTGQQPFAPLISPQQRVRSDVNISLQDPGNFVKGIYGKSDGGGLGFNLGTNMLASYM